MKKPDLLFIMLLASAPLVAQKTISTDEAVKTALTTNGWTKAAELQLSEAGAMRKTATDLGDFSVLWMSGQYNSLRQDNNFTFMQMLPFPALMAAKAKLGKAREEGAKTQLLVVRQTVELSVREVCDQLLYLRANQQLLQSQDSLFKEAALAAATRYRTGEGTLLEKMTAETQSLEAGNQVSRNASEILVQESRLRSLLHAREPVQLEGQFVRLELSDNPDTSAIRVNPQYLSARWSARAGRFETQVERRSLLPSVTVGYFNQSLIGYQKIGTSETFYGADKRFSGFQLGLSMPLWARPQLARAQAAGWKQQALDAQADQIGYQLRSELDQATQEWVKASASLNYYEKSANANASLILRQASLAYRKGELSYTSYLQSLQSALHIRSGYLQTLRQYNQSVLQILYLTGRFGQ